MKIKAYTGYADKTKTHYYREFTVVECIPESENLEELIKDTTLTSWLNNGKCVSVEEVALDCEQGSQDVYNYDFYKLTYVDIADFHDEDDEDKNIDDFTNIEYVCIEKAEDDELNDIKS